MATGAGLWVVGVTGWIELCWDAGRQLSVRRTPIFSFLALQKEENNTVAFSSSVHFLASCTEGDHIDIKEGCFTHLPAQQPVSWLADVRHPSPGQVGRQQTVRGQTRRTAHH